MHQKQIPRVSKHIWPIKNISFHSIETGATCYLAHRIYSIFLNTKVNTECQLLRRQSGMYWHPAHTQEVSQKQSIYKFLNIQAVSGEMRFIATSGEGFTGVLLPAVYTSDNTSRL